MQQHWFSLEVGRHLDAPHCLQFHHLASLLYFIFPHLAPFLFFLTLITLEINEMRWNKTKKIDWNDDEDKKQREKQILLVSAPICLLTTFLVPLFSFFIIVIIITFLMRTGWSLKEISNIFFFRVFMKCLISRRQQKWNCFFYTSREDRKEEEKKNSDIN